MVEGHHDINSLIQFKDIQGFEGDSPLCVPLLFVAVWQSDLYLARYLLNQKADANYKFNGLSLLYVATLKYDYEMCEALMQGGAKVDEENL